jgi:7,8-didemethyl-8-hydroxy-5-deazariboflavin synthase CofG subunit
MRSGLNSHEFGLSRTRESASDLMEFEDALNAALSRPVDRSTACRLIRARGNELDILLKAAVESRNRLKGRTVSYSKKVFIPLTNLCRDYCGYCTFRKDPGDKGARTMEPEEVLAVAEAGAKLGCKEALFSLGDRPEAIFPEMRETLRRLGHSSTLSYLADMCSRVLNQAGLLPHVNAGLLARKDIESLRPFSPSMGLMLENISETMSGPGMPHENAIDKQPAARIKTIEEAGRQRVPFTTGILIGIGETLDERVDSLLAIRDLHRRYGHIQEVIVQNFRAKPEIPMRDHPEPDIDDLKRTAAVARLILGDINVQAPPNLSDESYPDLLKAGINDWGGISPLTKDFINPEKPWPQIDPLRARTAAAGLTLRERLSVYPEYVFRDEFVDANAALAVRRLAEQSGLATETSPSAQLAVGIPG